MSTRRRIYIVLLWVVLSFVSLSGIVSGEGMNQSNPPGPTASISHGLFALTNTCNWALKDGKRVDLFQYEVDGVSNYVGWKDVEKTRGKYNFIGFERMIGEAVSTNKKLAYHILSGIHTPDWVYEEAGIEPYYYSYPGGKKVRTFLPWVVVEGKRVLNKKMLEIWKETIQAFSKYIHSHPNKDRIFYVAITGWPWGNGLELHMAMTVYSEFEELNWNREAEDLFIEYIKRCVDIFIEAFPDIPLGLAFSDNYGLNPSGIAKRSYRENEEIVNYALEQAKTKGATVIPMGLWMGIVSVDHPDHRIAVQMRRFKEIAPGFALEGQMGSYNSKIPLEDQLKSALDTGASWVQLWHHDIIYDDFQSIIKEYRKKFNKK